MKKEWEKTFDTIWPEPMTQEDFTSRVNLLLDTRLETRPETAGMVALQIVEMHKRNAIKNFVEYTLRENESVIKDLEMILLRGVEKAELETAVQTFLKIIKQRFPL